jgi:chorismate synthase
MSSIWGNRIKISIFGESHGEAVGVTMDGLPSGVELDETKIAAFLQRRSSRGLPWSTARTEPDKARILSGFYQGRTTGTPLCAMIANQDVRSGDYDALGNIPRPGHADLTATARYSGYQDPRGGGHFSGRLTAPIVFAGAVCKQILEKKNIHIFAHIDSIGSLHDLRFDAVRPDTAAAESLETKDFPVLDDRMRDVMIDRIMQAKTQLDSVGGVVECMATGIPAGLGNPIFDSVESRISSILFGIPAVKGVEFGAGFEVAALTGSQNNDVPFFARPAKTNESSGSFKDIPLVIRYKTNHAGGIEGGITNGMPVLFRAAFKPTPSIAGEQESIDLDSKENVRFQVRGRHDPCIVPRAVPVVEAACAIAILDLWMECFGEG